MTDNNNVGNLRKILRNYKKIAVVGLSANWHRPSYFAAKYMQEHGYKIIPINPNYKSILGERCYPTLSDAAHNGIDIVDCFRKSEDIESLVDPAIDVGAKVFWMQLGVKHQKAKERLLEAGIECVEDRCVKIEHARVFGGLNWVGVNTKIISAKRRD